MKGIVDVKEESTNDVEIKSEAEIINSDCSGCVSIKHYIYLYKFIILTRLAHIITGRALLGNKSWEEKETLDRIYRLNLDWQAKENSCICAYKKTSRSQKQKPDIAS